MPTPDDWPKTLVPLGDHHWINPDHVVLVTKIDVGDAKHVEILLVTGVELTMWEMDTADVLEALGITEEGG